VLVRENINNDNDTGSNSEDDSCYKASGPFDTSNAMADDLHVSPVQGLRGVVNGWGINTVRDIETSRQFPGQFGVNSRLE
jgi:hypothetical protein